MVNFLKFWTACKAPLRFGKISAMFFRILQSSLVVFAVCVLGGCYSMHTASSPDFMACTFAAEKGAILEHVYVQNNGWFLFERLPLICGNIDDEAMLPWTFFCNETDIAAVESKLLQRARSKDARIVHENVINSGTTLLSIPASNIALSIPYFICRRETQISAVLMQRNAGGGE